MIPDSAPKITGNPFFQLLSKVILGRAGNAWRCHKSNLLVLPSAALLCRPNGSEALRVTCSGCFGKWLSFPAPGSKQAPFLSCPNCLTQAQVVSKPLWNAWGNNPGSGAVNALVAKGSTSLCSHSHPQGPKRADTNPAQPSLSPNEEGTPPCTRADPHAHPQMTERERIYFLQGKHPPTHTHTHHPPTHTPCALRHTGFGLTSLTKKKQKQCQHNSQSQSVI